MRVIENPTARRTRSRGQRRGIETLRGFAERFVHDRVLVTQCSGNKPRYGIEDHRGGEFSARQHEVTDRDLIRCQVFGDAFVYTFVTPADQYDAVDLRETPRGFLAEHRAGCGEQNNRGTLGGDCR